MTNNQVSLINILRDCWLDKKKFPIVSIIGWADSTARYTGVYGDIWVGDYDVGVVLSDRVRFSGIRTGDGTNTVMVLQAADPDFFTHLENTLLHYMRLLKDISDEGEGG